MSIVVAAGIGLVLIAVVGVVVLIAVLGSAGSRNQNRADGEEDRARQERESGEQRPGDGGDA